MVIGPSATRLVRVWWCRLVVSVSVASNSMWAAWSQLAVTVTVPAREW
jgi:hypothetical protein